jgi:predicted Fe-S protein YdhL (DUF1289 family)
LRTLEEIADWMELTAQQKRAVLARIELRRQRVAR